MEAIAEIKKRLKAHNINYVDTDHGFCYSVYFFDPNGMQVEMATNVPGTEQQFAEAGAGTKAVDTMREWLRQDDLAGNNKARPKEGWVHGR